ncbi:MAG: dTDP-4-amino-4,6-dideoxygalactose transaminase [Promethearchaeia archaeon]
MRIPFNKPPILGNELKKVEQALNNEKLSGDGPFTEKAQNFLEDLTGAEKVLLTTSGTTALDMSALLAEVEEGDEVIMPSYTFVSTANAFVLRGANPVFVDIREDTLNIDERKIEDKITENTKAIVPVHYAGVSSEMGVINQIAEKHDLMVIEDAAQGVNAKYKGDYLGAMGDIGCYSFHETKNYTSGEGGAVLLNDEDLIDLAEIIWEKGTNRKQFFRGEVDKYTWVDLGSSFLMSDLLAAFLYAQLQKLEEINQKRKQVFEYYYENLEDLEEEGKLRLPIVPDDCAINYHMFFILLPSEEKRNSLMDNLKEEGIQAVFHYIPLHSSPMGKKFGYQEEDLPITESISKRLLRLPFYYNLTKDQQDFVINKIKKFEN